MPSTHSSTLSFYTTYAILCILTPSSSNALSRLSSTSSFLASVSTLGLGCTAIYSRVWLGHHTPRQCLAGASLGTCFAIVWWTIWYGLAGRNGLRESGEGYVELAKHVLRRVVAEM